MRGTSFIWIIFQGFGAFFFLDMDNPSCEKCGDAGAFLQTDILHSTRSSPVRGFGTYQIVMEKKEMYRFSIGVCFLCRVRLLMRKSEGEPEPWQMHGKWLFMGDQMRFHCYDFYAIFRFLVVVFFFIL